MAHYDDWVYDRGLEDEDWVHDRWGDDDDYDDDDYDDDDYDDYDEDDNKILNNKSSKKEKYKMYTKKFFNNIKFEYRKLINGFAETISFSLTTLIENNEFIAIDSIDGSKYKIYVQRDVQELASAFGIDLEDVECSNLSEANEVFINYKNLIAGELIDSIIKFLSQRVAFENGKIDFIDLYSDKQTLNTMINAVNKYYGDNTFVKMRSICKRFALNLDLSPLQNEIDKNIEERNKYSYNIGLVRYKESDAKVKRLYSLLTDIKSANCFSRETFAMLYIILEEYETKELALEKFDLLIKNKNFSILEI